MPKHLVLIFLTLPLSAIASWQADLESGNSDALGLVLFFYAFLVYVIVKDGFNESRAKGWKCFGACLVVGGLIITYKWAMAIACLAFLASFLWYCWDKLR